MSGNGSDDMTPSPFTLYTSRRKSNDTLPCLLFSAQFALSLFVPFQAPHFGLDLNGTRMSQRSWPIVGMMIQSTMPRWTGGAVSVHMKYPRNAGEEGGKNL